MSERRTRGQGNNPGVTKRKIIEILLKQSDWTPEPDIRDEIASELAIKEPKSTKIQLAAALEEGLILKESRSGVNYWNINFNSDVIPGFIKDIVTTLPEKDQILFFKSLYVQELVLKIAGFLAKTNHPKTRVGYSSTKISYFWGFLDGETIQNIDDDDDDLSEDLKKSVAFYRYVVTHSPSFFLYYFQDAAGIDPYLRTILGSYMLKTDWKDYDFLYFVGTMGLIVDYCRSEGEMHEKIAQFLTDNKKEIFYHTSLKNPERLFENMIQANKMLQERHKFDSGENGTQKAFTLDSGMFQKL